MGNKSFADITHVIVDEVHERSLLGDFLLIILKNFIEKQSAQSTQKLKVILMSATVDSQLFSHYFGDCPVIHAQGRTHPVTTHFLEDIHESIDYKLASDSLASLRSNAPKQKQCFSEHVSFLLLCWYIVETDGLWTIAIAGLLSLFNFIGPSTFILRSSSSLLIQISSQIP